MIKFIPGFLLFIFSFTCFGQRNETVKQLVNEGIVLHDKGDYEGAIKKYDAALELDANDYDANYEKSLSLLYAKKYEACVQLSKAIVERFPNNGNLRQAYSNWGSALDDTGRQEEAIEVFNKGIKKFPDDYLLYFNRGLTYTRTKRNKEALESYSNALKNNALHASSNYYTGLSLQDDNRIPALMAYITFIAVEPQSERSKNAYDAIQEIIYRDVKKEGNNTTISISTDMFDKKDKKSENDFSSIEFAFTLLGSMDNSKGMDSIAKSPADKFDFKLQMLINALENNLKAGKGFYWKHYVPFFVELKKKNFTIVISNLIYSSSDNSSKVWINLNGEKINAFYDWLKDYEWQN